MITVTLRFLRTPEEARLLLRRDGVWDEALPAMDPDDVAHELAHYAVESLGGGAGFLTLLGEGVAAERAREAGDAAALRVEALVAVVSREPDAAGADALGAACRRWGLAPFAPRADLIAEARALWTELLFRWERVPAGAALDLDLTLKPRVREPTAPAPAPSAMPRRPSAQP